MTERTNGALSAARSGPAGARRRRRPVAWLVLGVACWLGGLGAACGGPSAFERARAEVQREAERLGPRVAVANGLARAWAAEARGDRRGQAHHLSAILPLSPSLTDDRAVRDALAAADPMVSPPSVADAVALERALVALAEGRNDVVRASARPLTGRPGWLGARAAIAVALASLDGSPEAAKALLTEVARRPADALPGTVGRELRNFARLTLASQHYDAGRYGEALRGFLQVEETSGHWPAARLGLAWAQWNLGRPERTVAILALMPGGVAGEPERALLAAVATHRLGDAAVARDIVTAALARPERWDPARVDPDAVLARLLPEAPRPTAWTLVEVVAGRPQVLSLGGELLATRAERARGDSPALSAYEEALRRRFDALVASEAALAADAAAAARAQLETLRPQLVDDPR